MADFIVLATADWDHPLWTNKQHVAVALAAEGNRVLYVESLGLRSAQRTGRDLKRILKRLRRGLRLRRTSRSTNEPEPCTVSQRQRHFRRDRPLREGR